MKCPDCDGKGYKDRVVNGDYGLEAVREWCYNCKGSGKLKYNGDRTDIAWEGE